MAQQLYVRDLCKCVSYMMPNSGVIFKQIFQWIWTTTEKSFVKWSAGLAGKWGHWSCMVRGLAWYWLQPQLGSNVSRRSWLICIRIYWHILRQHLKEPLGRIHVLLATQHLDIGAYAITAMACCQLQLEHNTMSACRFSRVSGDEKDASIKCIIYIYIFMYKLLWIDS